MRVSVIGMPGSGKSTLARAISEKLSIPHIHLDRFWFESGGKTGEHDTPNIEDVRAKVRARAIEAISSESWVSDGFYSRVQPLIAERADLVIFLDIPLWRRLLGHAKRMMRRNTRHQELNMCDDVKFFAEIVRRDFSRRPKFKDFAERYADKILSLRSWKEVENYVAKLR
jgi:adenylate kinase family enzyme